MSDAMYRRVPAEIVRAHIRVLKDAGLGTRRIAELSGVHHATITYIVYGRSGHPPSENTASDIAERILAVRPDPEQAPPGARVPGVGTRRRIRALLADGWTVEQLAEHLDSHPWTIRQLPERGRVNAHMAAAVRDLYRELYGKEPPQNTPRLCRAVRERREQARRRGWPRSTQWPDELLDLEGDAYDQAVAEEIAIIGARPVHLLECWLRVTEEHDVAPLIVAGAREYARRRGADTMRTDSQIVRERRAGRTYPEIAASVGRAANTVAEVCRSAGLVEHRGAA